MITRRELLYSSAVSALTAKDSAAFNISAAFAQERAWDRGELVHVLPTVSHDRLLVKASFRYPLLSTPSLRIGASTFAGVQTDTHGECWRFDAGDLKSATHVIARGKRWQGISRALAAHDFSSVRGRSRPAASAHIHVRGWPRCPHPGERQDPIFAECRSPAVADARPLVQTRCSHRQWRSCVLGSRGTPRIEDPWSLC